MFQPQSLVPSQMAGLTLHKADAKQGHEVFEPLDLAAGVCAGQAEPRQKVPPLLDLHLALVAVWLAFMSTTCPRSDRAGERCRVAAAALTNWLDIENYLRLSNLRPAARPKESTYLGCCLKLSEVWLPIP